MAKLDKASDRTIKGAKPGRHCLGRGLWLNVTLLGARSWFYRFMTAGEDHWMGLGSYPEVTLAEAREKALDARRLVKNGVDPLAARRKGKTVIPTFGKMAAEVAASLAAGFRNEKHKAQWRMTLNVYAKPLRAMAVNEIETAHVLAVLAPLWATKRETANRLRGRIETVLDAAKAKGHRSGDNPASWKGNLKSLLPGRQKLAKKHHATLPYQEVAALIAKLRESASVAAVALEFAILTAARSGEALGARWDEIDLNAKVWTVPANRMKAGRPHSVPLSDRAVEIIKTIGEAKVSDLVFPGRSGQQLSAESTRALLSRAGVEKATTHGMRSAFRDWAGNETHTPREIAEHALAHGEGDATEASYRRDSALEKRRALMAEWAHYCEPRAPADNVVLFATVGGGSQ
jgi:integrase